MIVTIFDTETTGLIKPKAADMIQQPHITEIYCLKVRQEFVDGEWQFDLLNDFDQLLKVPVPLSDVITRITGLTDNMLADKPTFKEIYPSLAEFMTGTDRLVAHNLAFDSSMLANELVRINKVIKFPWPRDYCCTVEKSLFIEQRRMSLTKLHEHLFGEGFADAHRAKNDVLPLYRCYKKMVEEGMIK